jgi:hypothetical protein
VNGWRLLAELRPQVDSRTAAFQELAMFDPFPPLANDCFRDGWRALAVAASPPALGFRAPCQSTPKMNYVQRHNQHAIINSTARF